MLTAFAFIVLCFLVLLVVYAIVKLAQWPKAAALERGHPQADAINVLSWCGILLTAGVGWIIALTWAYAKPLARVQADDELRERVAELESQVQRLQGQA